MEQAIKEINISKPYFLLLSESNLTKHIRKSLIKQAPEEFYSVLTQIARHVLNNSFCTEDPTFCTLYKNTLYLIALPSTPIADKQKLLILEDPDFIRILFRDFMNAIQNDS